MPESTVINEHTPVITAIIPTYKRPELLRRAIQSVIDQTSPHFQVCVYDNASGDNTAAVVEEMARKDPRVKYVCHPENIGAFNNFQFALAQVDTPYFSIMSDDDYLLPDFYKVALAGFEKHPDAVGSVTDVQQVDVDGSILRMALETWTPGHYPPPEGLLALLAHGHMEWTGTVFSKDVLGAGLLDPRCGSFSDVDFTFRVAAHGALVVSKEPGAAFTSSVFQMRAPYPFDDLWAGLQKMIRNLTEDDGLPADVRAYAERILLARFEKGLFSKVIFYLSRGCPDYARKAAVVLRDQFGGRGRYLVLSAIINTYLHVPFARSLFNALIALRSFCLKRGFTKLSPSIWQIRLPIKNAAARK